MKYIEQLQLAAAWLNSVRNSDGGWGLNPGQASSIVNTAEALYVLNKAQRLPSDVEKTIRFLRNAIIEHPVSRGPFLRYFAFGIFGLLVAGVPQSDPLVQKCAEFLRQSQISSKGWPHQLNDQSPRVFPTFLALWALQMVEDEPSQQTLSALNWLLTIQKKDGGWGFTDDPNERSNAVCTAYALIVLRKLYITDSRVQKGKQWLIRHFPNWLEDPILGESIGGTDWYHCNPVWASIALCELGESVLSPPIFGTISYFQRLFDSQIGSWRQSSSHVVNVRSTFWAVLALETIRERLDLNDITEAQSIVISGHKSSLVSINIKGFGVLIPKAAFTPGIFVISGVCTLLYLAVSSQPEFMLKIDRITVQILISIVFILFSIMIFWKQNEVGKNLSFFLIALLFGIVLSIWLLNNTLFINFLNIIGFLLSLIQNLIQIYSKKESN
jgi:prenyltransferase beta subunit